MQTEIIIRMIAEAIDARKLSYSPYSKYPVGASILCESGKIYTGCNIENASYGLTVCAERIAVFNAISNGEHWIKAVAVIGSGEEPAQPCGACLQVISEFCRNMTKVDIIVAKNIDEYEINKLSVHLPKAFVFHQAIE